jgi:hypothetical protein
MVDIGNLTPADVYFGCDQPFWRKKAGSNGGPSPTAACSTKLRAV